MPKLSIFNYRSAISCITSLLIIPISVAHATEESVELKSSREKAVVLVRQGQIEQGMSLFHSLISQYPDDQIVLADYLTLRFQTQKFNQDDIALLQRIQPNKFPEYAQIPVIQGVRDLQQFNLALAWLKKFEPYNKNVQLQVMKAVLYAELNQPQDAVTTLKGISLSALNADQLTQVSYAYRMSGKPIESLNAAGLAYQKAPESISVQEEYFYALIDSGALLEAGQFLKAHPDLNDKRSNLSLNLELLQFSQDIKNAITRYKYLSNHGEGDKVSYADLDKCLAKATDLQKQVSREKPGYFNFYYNYIYALSFRGRSSEAIEYAQQLNRPYADMPAYVRHALANAYLRIKQPQQAETLYLSLLKEKNYPDMEVYSGLYYSYIEQEKFKQADQLIKDVDHLIPTYHYSNAKGEDKTTADDRYEYISLKGLNFAYRNELNASEKYYQDIVAKTPNNPLYLNNLATIQRWREQPLHSQKTLARLTGREPDKNTLINQMKNEQDLGNIQAWKKDLSHLLELYPDDSGVMESRKEMADRDHFSITHETTWGHSNSDQVNQSLRGTRDLDSYTRLNSPWMHDNYRVFAFSQNRSGHFDIGNIQDNRYGLGLEWASNRKDLTVALSQNSHQDKTGVDINWSQWLNDNWQYRLQYNSQAPIPLQALSNKQDGKLYSTSVLWRQNESRSAGLTYAYTDISDGNKQQDWTFDFTQRLQASPHHITDMLVSAGYGTNSKQEPLYFSPEQYYAMNVTLQHDWVTWRKYNQNFTQHFELGTGFYNQKNYGTKVTWNAQYLHRWSLSRTWQLEYGIGITRHPYDGKQEDRTYGLVGFRGIF